MDLRIQQLNAHFMISLKSTMAYFSDFVLRIFFQLTEPIIFALLWTAVYAASGTSTIAGMSLTSMYEYYFVVAAFAYSYSWLGWEVSEAVSEGRVLGYMLRPLGFPTAMFVESLVFATVRTALTTLPILALATLLFHPALSLASILMIMLIMIMSFSIMSLFWFTLGCMAFYVTEIGGVIMFFTFTNMMLGGTVIPLQMFPDMVQKAVFLLPFQLLFYVPARIFSGAINTAQFLGIVEFAIAWLIIMGMFAFLVWDRVKRKINVFGI